MKLRAISTVIVRLFALNLLITQGFSVVRYLFTTRAPGDVAFPVALSLVIVVAAVLWVKADTIANVITQGVESEGHAVTVLQLRDYYSVAFAAIGLFYAVGHLASILNWTAAIFKKAAGTYGTEWQAEVKGSEISYYVVPFVVGLVLLFNARYFATLLAKRQQAGEAASASKVESDASSE
jgi:hypothetical protein